MQKDFLGMQHSLLLQFFFYFFCLTDVSILWRICAYIHISDGVKIIYELPLLPHNTASVKFLHKLGVVGSGDWILITWAPTWWWLGENLTFNKTLYILYKHRKFLYTIILPKDQLVPKQTAYDQSALYSLAQMDSVAHAKKHKRCYSPTSSASGAWASALNT
jgi:hypothetical protein